MQLCIGRETQSCYRLLQWARMRARGESIRTFCLEGGWKRRTFYYRRGRALNRVAAFLNEQRAAKLAGERHHHLLHARIIPNKKHLLAAAALRSPRGKLLLLAGMGTHKSRPIVPRCL